MGVIKLKGLLLHARVLRVHFCVELVEQHWTIDAKQWSRMHNDTKDAMLVYNLAIALQH